MSGCLKPAAGTYAVIFRSRFGGRARIGRRREIDIVPGYYVYVGSAFGPGGVRARVLRHFCRARRRHWHIDYLRDFVQPVAAWYSYDDRRLEHRWAGLLETWSAMTAVPGFGCSDCRCRSHLYRTEAAPALAQFRRRAAAAGGSRPVWQTVWVPPTGRKAPRK